MFRVLTRMILDRLRRRGEARGRWTISIDASGMTVEAATGNEKRFRHEVPWHAISRITVFKRDLYVHDLICMLIEVSGGGALELDEEMEGWTSLASGLPLHLPPAMAQEEWFSKVAFPAFETSPVTIYVRGAAPTKW